MERSIEISIIKRIFENMKNRKLSDGSESSNQLPITIYTCPDYFKKEKEILFKEFPLMVGFSSQLPNAGDYITHNLTQTPIIVIRDKDEKLKAYVNTCRHRGARLLDAASGNCKGNLCCPYHGWCYSPKDGNLRGVPHASSFPNLDKNNYGLVSLAVEEKFGMIFVLPQQGKDFDLESYLAEIYQDLKNFGYENHVLYKCKNITKKANWKLHVEANSEGYHFAALHKNTSNSSYLNYGGLVDYFDPHSRLIAPQNSILNLLKREESEWQLEGNAGLVYFIFPNTLYFSAAGFAQVVSVYPEDESNCTFISGMLVPDQPFTPENTKLWDLHYENYWDAMNEDMDIAESATSSIRSGVNTHHLFGKYEEICYKFEKKIQQVINREDTLENIMISNQTKVIL